MNAVITTDGLTVRYGIKEALSSLTVRISGGTVGLLGPNGAGKSTLLKTLLGFLQPVRGTAEVLGKNVRAQAQEIRLRVGYFPERHVFIPELNGVDTVALTGELGGLPRTAALERAHEVLRFTGLGEARYRPVEGYSTGMLQRTKLAMALVHDPELVFLDEPTSGLDPTGRRQMLALVREVSQRHGISVILSTHLLHDVEAVCDGAVLLKSGKLIVDGDLETLKRKSWGIYEVRAREETPGRFRDILVGVGMNVIEKEDGLLHVTMKNNGTRSLFEAAKNASAEIRHLERFEPTLEEIFFAAINPNGEDAEPK
jgi:ABC-2 type transport system ATP-binding protein